MHEVMNTEEDIFIKSFYKSPYVYTEDIHKTSNSVNSDDNAY